MLMEDALYLYGVDYMSTLDIKTYFERFSTGEELDSLIVKWINDSACTVKFETVELCQKAY